jgi:hypothetical protein
MSILSAIMLGTDVVALPLASLLMKRSPWFPIIIADISFALGIISIRLLGEPPKRSKLPLSAEDENELDVLSSADQSSTNEAKPRKQTWWNNLADLSRNRIVFLLLIPIFCNALVSGIPDLLVIYVEKRLGWSISQVRYSLPLKLYT